MSDSVSNRQFKEYTKMAKQMWDSLDGDFEIFIADFKIQEVYDENGDAKTIKTPYLYVKR